MSEASWLLDNNQFTQLFYAAIREQALADKLVGAGFCWQGKGDITRGGARIPIECASCVLGRIDEVRTILWKLIGDEA